MQGLINGIAIGVVGGLVTTLFVVVFRSLWVSVLVPWFEERVYKDVRISGTWESEYADGWYGRDGKYREGGYGKEKILISQSSHRVTGTMTCLAGPDEGMVYEFEGEFKNLILTISYINQSVGSLDRGTVTLILKENGLHLEGYCTSYDDDEHDLVSIACSWKRETLNS